MISWYKKQCSTLSSPFFEANNCKETNTEVTVKLALLLCGRYVVLGGGGSFCCCVPILYDSLFGQVPYQVRPSKKMIHKVI